MTAGVVVIATDALGIDGRRQAGHLLRVLADEGRDVELVLLGRSEIGHWPGHEPIVDLDGPVRRRAANAAALIRPTRASPPPPAAKLRRHLRHRLDRPWILCDPSAAPLLADAGLQPSVLALHLADPAMSLPQPGCPPRGRRPDLVLALAPGQVRGTGDIGRIEVVGALGEATGHPLLGPATGRRRSVVLSAPPHRWAAIDHLVEVAEQLRRRQPDLPLVVLTDPGEDDWLVRHDVGRLASGASIPVAVRRRDEPTSLEPLTIVRTGYAASDPDLILAAAAAGIPSVGFELGDLPELGLRVCSPFAVEDLVDEVLALLDPVVHGERVAACRRAASLRGDPASRIAPLLAIL